MLELIVLYEIVEVFFVTIYTISNEEMKLYGLLFKQQ